MLKKSSRPFSAQSQVKSKKKSLHALRLSIIPIAYHLYITKVLCICLRREAADPGHLPSIKGLAMPLLYNEIFSRRLSDVGYTINGRVLNNWNRILLKLQ